MTNGRALPKMIRAEKLSIRRGARELIRNASFELYPGECLGLTGANGSGKSTLLATILGSHQADSGRLSIPAGWVIAHAAQETPATARTALDFTIDGDRRLRDVQRQLAEAIEADDGPAQSRWHAQLDALNAWDAESRAAQLLSGLGFTNADNARPVRDFSGGWRVRLNLAQALMCPSDALLLDEPTNHLDLDAMVYLERWLQRYRGALVLISHDREFLDATVGRVAHLADGTISLYTGNYSDCERQRAERDAQRESERLRQRREREHMQAFVDRFRAKASKSRQAQSRLKALAKLPEIAAARVSSGFNFTFTRPEKLPDWMLALSDATLGYANTKRLEHVELQLRAGERLGLIGRNGAGKSTLLKALAGNPAVSIRDGERKQHIHCKIGYYAQHQIEQLQGDKSPTEHIVHLDPKVREAEIRNYLGRFGFSGEQAFAPVAPFSGGERARLALACVIYQRPNVLLLDEPTNHLDLMARESLAAALQGFEGSLVIISHDRHVLRSCCDEFLLIDDGICQAWDGDLDDFADWLVSHSNAARDCSSEAATGTLSRRDARREAARHRAVLQPLTRRIQAIEAELAKLQSDLVAVQTQLADPELYIQPDKTRVADLTRVDSSLRDAICLLENEWVECHGNLDALQDLSPNT